MVLLCSCMCPQGNCRMSREGEFTSVPPPGRTVAPEGPGHTNSFLFSPSVSVRKQAMLQEKLRSKSLADWTGTLIQPPRTYPESLQAQSWTAQTVSRGLGYTLVPSSSPFDQAAAASLRAWLLPRVPKAGTYTSQS